MKTVDLDKCDILMIEREENVTPFIEVDERQTKILAKFGLFSQEIENAGYILSNEQKVLIDSAVTPALRKRRLSRMFPEKRRFIFHYFRKYLGGVRSPRCRVEDNLYSRLVSGISDHCLQNGYKHTSFNRQALEIIVGYSMEELKHSLETKFDILVSWDNMKDWHIDHIRPKSSFKFKTFRDQSFIECWSQENLRPIQAKENMYKGSNVIKFSKRVKK